MSVKICLPVSHHFESKEKVQKLRDLDLYDFLEVRPNKIDYKEDIEKQTAFHADNIQPIHNLKDEDFKFVEKFGGANQGKTQSPLFRKGKLVNRVVVKTFNLLKTSANLLKISRVLKF